MNTKKFFEASKEAGIETIELAVSKSKSIAVELYHGEIISNNISESNSLNARGIYDDRLGAASTTSFTNEGLAFLVREVQANAKINETKDKQIIFKGSEKYGRGKVFNAKLAQTPLSEKIALLHQIEKRLNEIDKRVVDVLEVGYNEGENTYIIENSYGLKLKDQSNQVMIYANVKAQDGESIKTGSEVYFDNTLDNFDLEKFCQSVVKDAVSRLNGKAPWEKKKCYTILSPDVTARLLGFFLGSASADAVQKHSSLLEGKLHQQVISKKLTIEEKPLAKNIFFRAFDDEGVATYNKKLFDKGVLTTYLYNLQTAQKDGVTTTANGYRSGNNIGTDIGYVEVKNGKISEEEMLSKDLREGVYLSDIRGLHAGLNAQSGNFSLEAEGFLIKDGKIAEPLGLITVAGNLIQLFKDVVLVANNAKLLSNGIKTPSIKVKSLSYSA